MPIDKNTGESINSSLLIVDDHETNRFVLRKILSELGVKTIEAESGAAAIEHLNKHKVFLILMDVNMPEMDGLETAKKIREKQEWSTIPIIFITGQNKEDLSIQIGYETGAVDYLLKPVDPQTLLSKVKVFSELQLKTERLESQNQQIAEQQQALEKSYEQLKKFSHVVAHDLKNPLSTMVSSMDLILMDGIDGKEGQEMIGMHQQMGYRLLKMIDELLVTASDINEMVLKPVELKVVLNNVLSDLTLQIKHRQATIEIDELPMIVGSETHLYQVFQNLISNALKYSRPNQPPEIQIKVNGDVKQGEMVQIDVIDNGQGFDANKIDRLFEPFTRLTEDGEGRGIGLSTVRQILESHGGSIDAHSEKGKGSTFILKLKVAEPL